MGEDATTTADGRVCRPSALATSRASACGGGMRMPDSCAAPEAAFVVPEADADAQSSRLMTR